MRTFLVTAITAIMLTAPLVASAGDIVLEEGVTFFDNGTCVEANGAEGIAMYDGQCMTAADYDAIYSYENLSQTDVGQGFNGTELEGKTIAEVYDIQDDGVAASERPLGEGLVEEPFTFTEYVERAFTYSFLGASF